MNKPSLATNMHLCCRDANHKHLYLLVNTLVKTGVADEKKEYRMRKYRRTRDSSHNVNDERVVFKLYSTE